MDKHYTDIIAVIDGSSSMRLNTEDVAYAFNAFVEEQRLVEDGFRCTVTAVYFREVEASAKNSYRCGWELLPIFTDVDLWDLEDMRASQIVCRARTPLYSGIEQSIKDAQARYAKMKDEDRPSQVIVVILCDGDDNASTISQIAINNIIAERQADGWRFVFIGIGKPYQLKAQADLLGITDRVIARSSYYGNDIYDNDPAFYGADKNVRVSIARMARNISHYRQTALGGESLTK